MTEWQRCDPPVWFDQGTWGGDVQVSDAFSTRWWLPAGEFWLVVTRIFYLVRVDGVLAMENQNELIVCTDPSDPGSSEEWSGATYSSVGGYPYSDLGLRQAAQYCRDPDHDLELSEEWPEWALAAAGYGEG